MVFTTTFFIFMFFPAAVALWLLGKGIDKIIGKNIVADAILVLVSVLFFGWMNFETITWFLVFISGVYVFGLLLEQARDNGNIALTKKVKIVAVLMLLCLLGYYKYRGFGIEIFNLIFAKNVVGKAVLTPLGISFLTFSAISYLLDIERGKANAGRLLDCAVYLSFFPKLVSGPVVLWRDFTCQNNKPLELARWKEGIARICIGFAKKVILADTFGLVLSEIDSTYAAAGVDIPTAWLAVILYWLQIYYDFSGYSDIAIGISKLFGRDFDENFSFPYRSVSVSEFWRRWHISLGRWFREYVYFPLGGSRGSVGRTLLNLACVFVLTGIWHGAGWNYLLWGALNGVIVVLERLAESRKWKKAPVFLKWCGTTALTVMFWELFRFPTVKQAYSWICVMIGRNTFSGYTFSWQYFLSASTVSFVVIGILGATLLGSPKIQMPIARICREKVWYELLSGVVLIGLFMLAILFMINSSYHPFIYFQF